MSLDPNSNANTNPYTLSKKAAEQSVAFLVISSRTLPDLPRMDTTRADSAS
jgi:hypothetical protein